MNLRDFHVTEIISEERGKIWRLLGLSESELAKEQLSNEDSPEGKLRLEWLLSDGVKQTYKYWDDGGEFTGETLFNLTRGHKPYYVGYIGQH